MSNLFVSDYRNFKKVEMPYAPTVDDVITDNFCRTDDVLNRPRICRYKMQDARDRYENAVVRASGVAGIRYDRDRVQTSHSSGDDALIAVVEAREEYENAKSVYFHALVDTMLTIDNSGATSRQKELLRLRYCNDVDLSWSQIGAVMNISTHAAEVMHTRAFVSVSRYIESQEVA